MKNLEIQELSNNETMSINGGYLPDMDISTTIRIEDIIKSILGPWAGQPGQRQ